jgi:alginate O-acetyltransferase complex protein AlgI
VTFNSLQYLAFLGLVFALYWRLDGKRQNALLLFASYVFYGFWDWRFLGLIALSTVADYAISQRMAPVENPKLRKRWLWASISLNLGLLGVFKYFGFFSEGLTNLLNAAGADLLAPSVDIILPVGISFYTFQTISYSFDVYRRRMPAHRSLLEFATFVAMFPQLVAGPIERADHLLPQVARSRRFPVRADIETGIGLIVLGLFKKVVIADTVARVVDASFTDPESQSSIGLVMGVYAFAFQIYADFSAYSDIARGSARLLGFELMENFAQPYLSRNIQEFWRTWHISLSSWLRDYLYVPLGGNRGAAWRTNLNLMVVMLLGGLWHGASWNFVIWGGLHGFFLGAHRLATRRRHVRPSNVPRPRDIVPIVVTFHVVCFAWVFFRAADVAEARAYLSHLSSFTTAGAHQLEWLYLAGVVIAVDLLQRAHRNDTFFLQWRYLPQGLVYGTATAALLIFSGGSTVDFIYFQF